MGKTKQKKEERPLSGRAIEPLPPWHPGREYITIREMPVYLKKLIGVTVNWNRAYDWIHKGTEINGRQVYLKASKFNNRWVIKKKDLLAYLEAGSTT